METFKKVKEGNVLIDDIVHYKHSFERGDIIFSPFELHHYLVAVENN